MEPFQPAVLEYLFFNAITGIEGATWKYRLSMMFAWQDVVRRHRRSHIGAF
jgi:hypothetical protein